MLKMPFCVIISTIKGGVTLKEKEPKQLNSVGIVKNIINLDNGSIILYIEDIASKFVLQEVINFAGTNLKVNDLVNINYQMISDSKSEKSSLQYFISPLTRENIRYSSTK